MTDSTSDIVGDYPGGVRITCILNEGAPTVATSYDAIGHEANSLTWAAELEENNLVAITNTTDVTYAACGGIPCVEIAVTTETLVIGRIVSTPKLQNFPATTAAADSLAKQLAGEYYRTAVVEIWGGITKVADAIVQVDGTNACVPGVGSTLNFNITDGYADDGSLNLIEVASTGVGLIPFHYVPATTAGDTHTILVGITGMIYAVTGS